MCGQKALKNLILNSRSVQVLTHHFAKWRQTRKTEPVIWQQPIGFSYRYNLFPFRLLPPAAFSPVPAWLRACRHGCWQTLCKRLEESGMLKKRLHKHQPWPSTGHEHSMSSKNPSTPRAHLMVGLLPKLIPDSACAFSLPQECRLCPDCSRFWRLLGNISFWPSPVLTLYCLQQQPTESSKQESWGTAQGCKKIFLHTLDYACDKERKHAETTPRVEKKRADYISLKLRHAE